MSGPRDRLDRSGQGWRVTNTLQLEIGYRALNGLDLESHPGRSLRDRWNTLAFRCGVPRVLGYPPYGGPFGKPIPS